MTTWARMRDSLSLRRSTRLSRRVLYVSSLPESQLKPGVTDGFHLLKFAEMGYQFRDDGYRTVPCRLILGTETLK